MEDCREVDNFHYPIKPCGIVGFTVKWLLRSRFSFQVHGPEFGGGELNQHKINVDDNILPWIKGPIQYGCGELTKKKGVQGIVEK